MKKLVILSAILISTNTMAGWADSDFYEPTLGCATGSLMGFSSGSSEDTAARFQSMAIGCAVGGLVGHMLNSYYDEKVGRKYLNTIDRQEAQLKSFKMQQAFDAVNGIDRFSTIKKEVIEGSENPDGSIDLPSLRIRVHAPGTGMPLGD